MDVDCVLRRLQMRETKKVWIRMAVQSYLEKPGQMEQG